MLRVLHGFEEVSGQVSAMAAAQRALGADARAMTFRPHGFGYEDALAARSPLARRLDALRFAFLNADVVHLYFGTSLLTLNRLPDHDARGPLARARRAASRLLWMRDVSLLKRLGKTVAVTFLGDDVRQVAVTRASGRASHLDGPYGDALAPLDARKRRLAALVGRHADAIFAVNPDLLDVLPAHARFLPYVPPRLLVAPERPRRAGGELSIAHAPSDRAVKGTSEIQGGVARAAEGGVPMRFDLISGVAHAEVLARVGRADVFIDQLRVGWYGVAALEALLLGCVVLARLEPRDLARLPPEMGRDCPILHVETEADVARELARLHALSPAAFKALGARGTAWARRWHDPASLAATVLAAYAEARDGT